jgi:hypothetical protein
VSWRANLLGALAVIIAGVLVGVVLGGKTTTKVSTATVVRTVNVEAPASTTAATTATEASGAGSSEPAGATTNTSTVGTSGAGAGEKYLADYLEAQGGASKLNTNAENASMLTNPAEQELAGQTYEHAVAFEIAGNSQQLSASYQIPTPGFSRLTSAAIGLITTSNAKANYHLAVYKNDDNSPSSVVLYQANFRGPSTVHHMSFAIEGATDLLFVWTHKGVEPESDDVFVLADPVLDGS